jgi:hypothetical protein
MYLARKKKTVSNECPGAPRSKKSKRLHARSTSPIVPAYQPTQAANHKNRFVATITAVRATMLNFLTTNDMRSTFGSCVMARQGLRLTSMLSKYVANDSASAYMKKTRIPCIKCHQIYGSFESGFQCSGCILGAMTFEELEDALCKE